MMTGVTFGIIPISPVRMLINTRMSIAAIIMNDPAKDFNSPRTIFPFISANSATAPMAETSAPGKSSSAAFSASAMFDAI